MRFFSPCTTPMTPTHWTTMPSPNNLLPDLVQLLFQLSPCQTHIERENNWQWVSSSTSKPSSRPTSMDPTDLISAWRNPPSPALLPPDPDSLDLTAIQTSRPAYFQEILPPTRLMAHSPWIEQEPSPFNNLDFRSCMLPLWDISTASILCLINPWLVTPWFG